MAATRRPITTRCGRPRRPERSTDDTAVVHDSLEAAVAPARCVSVRDRPGGRDPMWRDEGTLNPGRVQDGSISRVVNAEPRSSCHAPALAYCRVGRCDRVVTLRQPVVRRETPAPFG